MLVSRPGKSAFAEHTTLLVTQSIAAHPEKSVSSLDDIAGVCI